MHLSDGTGAAAVKTWCGVVQLDAEAGGDVPRLIIPTTEYSVSGCLSTIDCARGFAGADVISLTPHGMAESFSERQVGTLWWEDKISA